MLEREKSNPGSFGEESNRVSGGLGLVGFSHVESSEVNIAEDQIPSDPVRAVVGVEKMAVPFQFEPDRISERIIDFESVSE